ncbi:S9 family peptidase [Acrocarpospora macrocephala]|uniref:Peptidase n=1 Tax=Acrocarpospora macrocephala TaxID=150177 RepID=A0A5M3WT57_9ACTN|nr:peptidase [Acrocarpospora macrocephala]
MRPQDLAADRLLTELDVAPNGALAAVIERRVVRGKEHHRLLTVPIPSAGSQLAASETAQGLPVATEKSIDSDGGPPVVAAKAPIASGERRPTVAAKTSIASDEGPPSIAAKAPIASGGGRPVVAATSIASGERPPSIPSKAPIASGVAATVIALEASTPRFSPDGRTLAYLFKDQLHTRPSSGGPATKVTSFPKGVTDYAWFGASFVVVAPDEDSPVMSGKSTARVIRRLDWREDGHGLRLHPTHLHLIGPDGRTVRLTSGEWWASSPRVAPCGTKVGFIADPRPDADLDPNPQVYEVPLAGGPITLASWVAGPVTRFSYDPDGTVICVAAPSRRPTDFENEQLWHTVPDRSPISLTGHLDRFSGQAPTTDERLTVTCDNGREIAQRVTDTGIVDLTPVRLDPVVHALAAAGGVVCAIATFGGAARPDLYRLTPEGDPELLFRSGVAWLSSFERPIQRELEIDGIQVFLVGPPSDEPLPVILQLHGGPAWAWPVEPDTDALLLAAAGFLVVRPNIRGSFHRGYAFGAALGPNWGDPDAEDCHTVLDALITLGLADPTRIGCYGNSYGGFLTNWLIGTSDRFRAAVSQNGVTNQISSFAACDLGAIYDVDSALGDVWTPEGIDHLWKISPLRHVATITTPLLLLQGEQDHRCPPSDAEQMFVALRRLGRKVEYILYPDSDHSLTHTARLDRRIDRTERMIAWFQTHLLD